MDSPVINPHIIPCEGHSLQHFPFLVPQRLNLRGLNPSCSLCTLMVVGITANYNEPCTLLGPGRIDSSLRPAIVFAVPYCGQQIATLNVQQWYNARCWLFVEQYVRHMHMDDVTNISVRGVIRSRRVRWAGHVSPTGAMRKAHRVLVGKP
jgi:hypothetical protein